MSELQISHLRRNSVFKCQQLYSGACSAAWHAEVGHHHIQTQISLAEENTERECRHLDDKVEVVELADVSVGDCARLRVGGRLEQP